MSSGLITTRVFNNRVRSEGACETLLSNGRRRIANRNSLHARGFAPFGCILPLPMLADRFRHLRQPFPVLGLFQHFLCGKVWFRAVWWWIPQRL